MQVKPKGLTKCFLVLSLKYTHKYRISSGKHSQRLFNVKALSGGPY